MSHSCNLTHSRSPTKGLSMKYIKKLTLPTLIAPVLLIVAIGLLALSNRTSVRNHRLEDLDYALDNEDAVVRLGAIVELVEYEQSAVPLLKRALHDPDVSVKKTAIAALGRIGGQPAAEAVSSDSPAINPWR